jgi:hypothetical protein
VRVGLSGDSSCADHNIAWRVRNALALDYVPAGVSTDAKRKDNIIYDIKVLKGEDNTKSLQGVSTGGWGHPTCSASKAEVGVSQGLPTPTP